MAKKKGKVRIITLECTEARKEGKSPSRYTSKKNFQTHPERLEKMKYNPSRLSNPLIESLRERFRSVPSGTLCI
jgi:large subunit ribosomal protein L33